MDLQMELTAVRDEDGPTIQHLQGADFQHGNIQELGLQRYSQSNHTNEMPSSHNPHQSSQ